MSITNATNPPISYKIDSGTLTQADWDFLFQIFAEEDILVVLDGVTQTLNSDYTVAINGEDGGTVTFEAAVVALFTVGKIITLFRNLAAVRQTSYESTQRFDPVDVDGDMDYLTSLSGQVNGNFNQLAARFPTNYPFINIPGYNLLPLNWPDGYALINQGGTLTTAPIQPNAGDPLLRGELAVQVAPNEGTRLVGHTGETLYSKLANIDDKVDAAALADQVNPNEGARLVGYTGETVYDRLVANTTNIGTNTTNIGTNTTNIGTNTAAIADIPFAHVTTNDGIGTIDFQKNVSSVTKVSTGIYDVNFATPPANANYIVVGIGTTFSANFVLRLGGRLTNKAIVELYDTSGALGDGTFQVAIFI